MDHTDLVAGMAERSARRAWIVAAIEAAALLVLLLIKGRRSA